MTPAILHSMWLLLLLLITSSLVQATPITKRASALTYAWKILYQNDADWGRALSSTRQTSYMIYTGNITNSAITSTCAGVNEVPVTLSGTIDAGLQKQLQYLIYDKTYFNSKAIWIKNTATSNTSCSVVVVTPTSVTLTTKLCTNTFPVLCTQSAPRTTKSAATNKATYAIQVNGLTAFRDAFSFRFMQLPYANTPQRFAPSTVYTPGNSAGKSSVCPQPGNPSSEDCLVTNVYTPVITPGNSNIRLKSVIVWLHGGGLSSGTGQDATFDGGSMASRGDVVVVTPNYRLGTIGYLPINNGATGNYGVSDVITVLKWVQANAATFGGDKTRVTLAGQSAGAQLVATILSMPSATGLYANAIMQSTRPVDVANKRMTSAQALAGPAGSTISALGCSGAADVLACLRGLNTSQILAGPIFSVPVVDGAFVTEPNIDMAQLRKGYVNKVPVIMGFMKDEAASLNYAPPTTQTSLDAALKAGAVNATYRQIVEGNTNLFPVSSASNGIQNLTVTVETDVLSVARCGQAASMYSAATTGVFSSLYTYYQDQRAYQIQNYDPFKVCLSTTSATSGYYLCHSGDLYPTFNTAGYVAQYPVRDADDINHSSLMMDLWTTFARSGNPNPSASYLSTRGYTTTASRLNSAGGWTPTTASSMNILSLGPNPAMKSLSSIRGPQCNALGLPLTYIAQGK